MLLNDFSTTASVLDGKLQVVSAYNKKAFPNTEKEVHTHYDRIEIYLFLKGNLYFAFEGGRIPVEEGSMIIIDSGTLHRPIIKEECEYERKRILVNRELLRRLNVTGFDIYPLIHQKQIIVLDNLKLTESGCDKLFYEIEKATAHDTPYDHFCALINLCSLLINAEKTAPHYSTAIVRSPNEKIAAVLEYINANLKSELSYKVLSKIFYISEKNLYKIFKKETGFTLSDYIKERRIIKALALLNSGLHATKVAEEVGFSDYSVFYRTFIKKVGITPIEYIKNSNIQ